jgi:hypothetical protein
MSITVSLLADSTSGADRPFVNLARRNVAQISGGAGSATPDGDFDRAEFIQGHLDRADELIAAGKRVEALRIWESVVSLYSGNRELEPLVETARERAAEQFRSEEGEDRGQEAGDRNRRGGRRQSEDRRAS